jgi:hypothetical protein
MRPPKDAEKFEEIAKRIGDIYWTEGKEPALEDCDRTRAKNPFFVRLQDANRGPYVTLFFHDAATDRELYRTTVWDPAKV